MFVLLCLFTFLNAFSQDINTPFTKTLDTIIDVSTPFIKRFDTIVNGDFTHIANNTVSNSRTRAYNGQQNNDQFSNMTYVDIDGSVTIDGVDSGSNDDTFCSSNASFINPFESDECISVIKAYLYWAAADRAKSDTGEQENITWWNYDDILLKLPNSDYTKFTADKVIYRGRDKAPIYSNEPFVCIKDITSIVQSLDSPFGKYQVANVESKIGRVTHKSPKTIGGDVLVGASGGWQIVFVYENETSQKRSISLFDGYSQIASFTGNTDPVPPLDILIDGFETVDNNSPVNANILFAGLEGDRGYNGDQLSIKNTSGNYQALSTNIRNSNNFFSSSITLNNANFTNRQPASTNTLGFDAGLFKLKNPNNSIIGNGQTSVELRLSSKNETFGLYLIGFSVEVFSPNLGPIKTVSDNGNTEVNPNQEITNTIEFKNNGNDDALGAKLTTKIANQVDLVEPITNLPTGITYTYDATSRMLTFNVSNTLVEVGDPLVKINYKTKVKDFCFFLTEGCENLAFNSQVNAEYIGVYNKDKQTTTSSNETSECGGNNEPNAFKIKLGTPSWTNENIDKTVECDDTDALKNAQALKPNVAPKCDNVYFVIEKIAGEFVQTNDDCAAEGYYLNTFKYSDKCGNTLTEFKQKITVVDTTPPDITDCSKKLNDLILDCGKKESLQKQADEWHKNNITTIAQCATDNCTAITVENIKHDYSFIVTDRPICEVSGEKTPIEYKIFDACGTAKPIIKVLNIIYKDESGPEVELCKDKIDGVTEIECTSSDPLDVINDWNTKNINALLGCAKDECNPELPVRVIDSLGPFNKTCGNSGTIEAYYFALDTCKQRSAPIKALLRIKDGTGPIISDECKAKLDAQGECDADATEDETIQWNKNNYEYLKCVVDDCSDIKSITDDYDFDNYEISDCGGKLKVTYLITDECDNTTFVEAFYYTGDAQPPLITCTFTEKDNLVLECGIDNYDAKIKEWKIKIEKKLTSSGCIVDECTPDLIPILTNNLDKLTLKDPVDCGVEGASKNPVEFYVTDNCENTRTLPLLIYVQDTTAPEITPGCAPVSKTFECQAIDVTTNEIKAWDEANKNALIACSTDGCAQKADILVTSSLDLNDLPDPDCKGQGKAKKITYKISDGCNILPFTIDLKIEDADPPTIDKNCLSSLRTIVECAGDNTAALKAWENEIIGELRKCSSDGCALTNQLNIYSNLDSIKLPEPDCKNLAKPVDVKFNVADICGNFTSYILPVKIQDTTPPKLDFNLKKYLIVRCDSVPPVPPIKFKDNCFGVAVQKYTADTIYEKDSDDFKIIRKWAVSDGCQTANFDQTIDVISKTFKTNYDNDHCIDDGLIDLNKYIDLNEKTIIDWEFVDGPQKSIKINEDGTFDPMQIDLDSLGVYSFNYFSTNGLCFENTTLDLGIHDKCLVYPCGPENFKFTKTVTPNGDEFNEYFTVIGSRECEFQIDIKIFNRWGAIIYENDDYQNDWNGFTNKASIGTNGRVTNGTYFYIINLVDSGFKRFTGPIYVGTK